MLQDGNGHPSQVRLYGLIGLMTFGWSLNYIFAKYALREFPALLASSIRMVIAGLAMLPVYYYYARRKLAGWRWADVPKLIGVGVFGAGLNQVLFVVGISKTSVAHAGIMIALTPILVLLLAWALGQEKLRMIKVLGMAVAMAGVLVIRLTSGSERGASLLGDALVFGAAVLFAIFSVAGKRAAETVDRVTLSTFAYVGTGLALMPVVWLRGTGFPYTHISAQAWLSVFYMAIVSSVLCYVIYYYALQFVPASRVATFSYLQPFMATLLAIPLLGEMPTTSVLTGGAMVLTGVFLTERA